MLTVDRAHMGGCVPKQIAMLDLTNVPQEHSSTCWAGVTRTIGAYFNRSVTECTLIADTNATCPCTTCPDSGADAVGDCNNGAWPNFAAVNLVATTMTNDTSIPLEVLKDEISCHGRPVAFSWHEGGGAGHIMVAYGYDGDDIYVADPQPACEGDMMVIPYDNYRDGTATGMSHWNDFYAIHPGAIQ